MTSLAPQRIKFTVDDYYKMAEFNLLDENRRVELINGDIVYMSPISSKHASVVDFLLEEFIFSFRKKVIVRAQNPIIVNTNSAPEPDIVLAKYDRDRYDQHHPRPEEVVLLIEVAESSLPFDRTVKRDLYATANIPEYWIINLVDEQVEIFRQPENGVYQVQETHPRAEKFTATVHHQEITFKNLFG